MSQQTRRWRRISYNLGIEVRWADEADEMEVNNQFPGSRHWLSMASHVT